MNDGVYYVICGVLTLGVLVGISMMSKVESSVKGNGLSAICTAAAILVTLYKFDIVSDIALWVCVGIGLIVGLIGAYRVKMIDMPQTVALLNGFGGAASALVAAISMLDGYPMDTFGIATGGLALAVGMVTLTGSLVAGGKLHKLLPQKPVVWRGHQTIVTVSLVLVLLSLVAMPLLGFAHPMLLPTALFCILLSGFFGVAFAIRVGGADMPITISLLNSFSGVAGSIAGMAIGDPLLVAIGGVVGASGLLLTQIMCRSMNRSLSVILLGKTSAQTVIAAAPEAQPAPAEKAAQDDPSAILAAAKKVVIVPGYGMAIAQAQRLVKQLADTLEGNGASVVYAIHPVAGRMPGHMNVLLCEVDVPYEDLREMDEVNPQFADYDVAIVIGANDVVNPAANTAENTPIYGMPVLNVEAAKHIIICNFDLNPGYAGVPNPLYTKEQGVSLLLGDAKDTIKGLLQGMQSSPVRAAESASADNPGSILADAKKVILVPGYGMAIAQAQSLVKQLADTLADNGASVVYAIHPVAGRMPGHMNVLLCEVDVPYEDLREMDEVNPQFADCDVAVIIGANDVVNPAANTAENTPIYGMPVLNVEAAKHIIICNFDLNPGYAGVPNPLYTKEEGVSLLLGDAKESLKQLIEEMSTAKCV